MDFYINDEKVDITIEEEKTVGDVLKSFEITCEENNAAVIGISINDKNVTAEIFDEVSKESLTEDMTFKFNVVTKQNISDSFSHLSVLFRQLAKRMQNIPVELQSGKAREAHDSIKTLADSIDEFCHIAALASLFKEYTEVKINDMPFIDFFKDFSPVLSDFEEALKSNDTVSVGDLSEYEICPRLEAIAAALEEIV